MTKSDNTTGNPWHAEDGKFTSPDAASLGVSLDDFKAYSDKLDHPDAANEFDDNALDIFDELADFDDNALDIFDELTNTNVEYFKTYEEIIENIPKVITKDYADKVLQHYKADEKYSYDRYVAYYNDGQDEAIRKQTNIFIQEMIETRFKGRRANRISQAEYDEKIKQIKTEGSGQLNAGYDSYMGLNNLPKSVDKNHMQFDLSDPEKRDLGCGLISVYKGIIGKRYSNNSANDEFQAVKGTFLGDNDTVPVVPTGGSLGSTYYFSMKHSYALDSYTRGRDPSKIIHGIINTEGINIITEDELDDIAQKFWAKFMVSSVSKTTNEIRDKVYNAFWEATGQQDAQLCSKLADDFSETLKNNKGLIAVVAGAQMIFGQEYNGMQCDVYDLGILDILDQ